MLRRAMVAAAVVALLATVVVAASSGELRLWDPPASSGDISGPAIESDDGDDARGAEADVAVRERTEPVDAPDWLMQMIVLLLAGVVVSGIVVAVRRWRPWAASPRRRGDRAGFDVLPVVPTISIDGAAARRALGEGSPRNGIVACWMQLERQAADVGLARHDAETSSEYVERVVGASSVDEAPIAELAALFRLARFSHHELGEKHRQSAVAALERVEAALRTTRGVHA